MIPLSDLDPTQHDQAALEMRSATPTHVHESHGRVGQPAQFQPLAWQQPNHEVAMPCSGSLAAVVAAPNPTPTLAPAARHAANYFDGSCFVQGAINMATCSQIADFLHDDISSHMVDGSEYQAASPTLGWAKPRHHSSTISRHSFLYHHHPTHTGFLPIVR